MAENKEVNKDEEFKEVLEKETDRDEDLDDIVLKKDKEIEDNLNSLLRLQADFNNYKRRTEKEKESLVSYGVEKIACGLFPILDNFERALNSCEDKTDNFFQGVEMIYNQLYNILADNGIKEINPLHEKFDPNFHEAVHITKNEEYEEGTIVEVYKKGYMLNDRILKYSEVIVAE